MIMADLIDDAHDNYRRVIRGALLRAYNRGFEAGCVKAQEQMMTDVDAGEISDGYHTFNDLYLQRMYLFAALVKAYKDKAWKSLSHEDGEPCFGGGWFIVGIDTPEGSYTYHYEDNFFSLFDCEELERGKHFDGHTSADVGRLMSLTTVKAQEQMMDAEVKE